LTNQTSENKLGNMKVPLLLAALAGLICCNLAQTGDQPLPPPRVVTPDFNQFQLQGAGSCAAAACHNGNRPPGTAGSEYSTWILHDKHSRAYEVLFTKRSKQIQQSLLKLPSLEKAHPEKNRLCLDCHVHPGIETAPKREAFHMQDGVSCETCHGPAEKWLTRHARAEWKDLSIAGKEKLGMRDTKTLTGRAGVCVDCHVGKPGSDVNHDLIAAGHPRLNFEFGAYHANMPHHWNNARDKDAKLDDGRQSGPDFEARAWAVGQAITAQAALKLLAHRAGKESSTWPEFAEYDCFACHHNLQGKSQLRNRKRPAGSYPWGTWYFSMPRLLARKNKVRLPALEELEREMSNALPRRELVSKKALAAEKEIRLLVERLQDKRSATKEIADLFSHLAGDEVQQLAGWDDWAQQYLGLAALHNAWKDGGKPPPSLAPTLKEMAEVLRFPKGFDSPNSSFSPKMFRDKLLSLQKGVRGE
jgi:hypothetical protein